MVEHRIANLADLHEDRVLRVDFFGRPLIVYRVGDRPVAALDACSHVGGPLDLKDGCLQCAWHGARFEAEHGARLRGPAESGSRLVQLPLEVRADGSVWYVYAQPATVGARFYQVASRAQVEALRA